MTSNQRKNGYIAIDIEKAGDHINQAIIAIGVAYGDTEGNLDEKRRFCFAVPEEIEFKPSTLKWWKEDDNKKKILEQIKKEAVPLEDGMRNFLEFWSKIEEKYPDNTATICSDNPAYDIGHIDFLKNKLFGGETIRFTTRSKGEPIYRWIIDPSVVLWKLGIDKEIEKKVNQYVEHDHMPDNDAYFIYLCQVELDKLKPYFEQIKPALIEKINS